MQIETASICWSSRIADCADFIIRILGGADVVVPHLRAGMLRSCVKVAASLIGGQESRRAIDSIASHRVLPRERFSPLTN
jgi:hypothetical protein